MGNTITVTITISVDTPDGVTPEIAVRTSQGAAFVEPSRPASIGPGAEEADALRAAVKAMAPLSSKFIRIVAESALQGETVTVDMDLVRRMGFEDGRFVGGAIGAAATKLYKAVGMKRYPLQRLSENPPVWMMTKEDARIVAEALA